MQVMRTWTCCHAILRRFTVLVLEFPSLTKFGWWKIGLWTPWDVSPLDELSWIITNHHVYLVQICANPTWMVCRMPPCTMVQQPLNPKASRLGGLVALLACVPRKSTTAHAGRVVTRAATEDEGLQTGFSIHDESWGCRKWWRRLKDLKEPATIFGGVKDVLKFVDVDWCK